jgi:hypothetical protein
VVSKAPRLNESCVLYLTGSWLKKSRQTEGRLAVSLYKKSVSKASSRFCCVATNLEFVLKFERIPFNATEVLILKNDE